MQHFLSCFVPTSAGGYTGRDDSEKKLRHARIIKHDRSLQVRFRSALVLQLCNFSKLQSATSSTWQHPLAKSTYEQKLAIGLCQLSTNSSNLLCNEKCAVRLPYGNHM
uniref:Uncharacterized protein n=1 Tax=Rhipicephalus zambeziensis TaxID=60191 RepID=A0A224YLZ4_9ACAR